MRKITKLYRGVPAVKAVDFDLRKMRKSAPLGETAERTRDAIDPVPAGRDPGQWGDAAVLMVLSPQLTGRGTAEA